jgi:ppGpp synthetase/RelA/SpoT-type nucleotidyltranferase
LIKTYNKEFLNANKKFDKIMKCFSVILLILLQFSISLTKKKTISKLIPWNQNNYDNYLVPANALTKELRKELSSATQNLQNKGKKSWCIVAPPKSLGSLNRKITMELSDVSVNEGVGKDFEEITDLVRCSFVIQSIDDVNSIRDHLTKIYGPPVKIRDNFANPKSSGYRDQNLIFKASKYTIPRDQTIQQNKNLTKHYEFNFEVQIHLCNIFFVKQIEHSFYEAIRLLEKLSNDINFEKVLSNAKMSFTDWENLVSEVEKVIKEVNLSDIPEFTALYNVWKMTPNPANANNLIQNLRKISNNIYSKTMADYEKDKNSCMLTGVENRECTLNNDLFNAGGLSYIKKVWNEKK